MGVVGRVSFLVDGVPERSLPERVTTVRCLLEHMMPLARHASIDGFSDVADLPEEVSCALGQLREHSPEVHRGWRQARRTYMAIPVALNEPSQRAAFLLCAPFAIHAELVYDDGSPLLVLDDTSMSIEVTIDPSKRSVLTAVLPEGASLRPVG